ncbi:hypothetical protein ACI65C_006964 [Semiaphis heraclei]
MSSSAGLNQAGNKLKSTVANNSATSSGFQLVGKNDNTISESEFFEGVKSPVTIDALKRINIKKDGNIVQTRIVELKFVAPKIPSVI